MSDEVEVICVQRFLNWYKSKYNRHCIYQRTTICFPELNKINKGDWDFVAYERDNSKNWIGIEIKELCTTREVSRWFEFWGEFCSELTKALAVKEFQGSFIIINLPVLNLKPRERPRLRDTFMKVLCQYAPSMKVNEKIDIGPYIAEGFAHWPKERSEVDEWERWGRCRPSKLQITKTVDAGCKVTRAFSPIVPRDVEKINKQTFDEADIKHANEQLKLAKERGARETTLLLACSPLVRESLVRGNIQELDSHLISNIDHIFMVNISGEDRVVEI